MSKKIKLAGIMLGAALTTTAAFAGNGACGAGKCGGEAKKKVEKTGCGAGKCGGEKAKEMKGACGAGKCGGDMKNKDMHNDMKPKQMKNEKASGSCGAGKCGSK